MDYSEASVKHTQHSAPDNLDGLTERFKNLVECKKAQLHAVKAVTAKPNWLAPVDGIEVRFLDVQLNQSDLDVWM